MDVCKKLELNPLRFDRDIRVLSKKKIFSKFSFFRHANEKRRNYQNPKPRVTKGYNENKKIMASLNILGPLGSVGQLGVS